MAPPPKIPGEENEQQENILNEEDDLPGGNLSLLPDAERHPWRGAERKGRLLSYRLLGAWL